MDDGGRATTEGCPPIRVEGRLYDFGWGADDGGRTATEGLRCTDFGGQLY